MAGRKFVLVSTAVVAALVAASVLLVLGPMWASDASAAIRAAEGGTVALRDEIFVRIPAGAMSRDATVKISKVPVADVRRDALEGAIRVGNAFEITTGDVPLVGSIVLEVSFDPSHLPPGASMEAIFLARYDHETRSWSPVYGPVDAVRHTIAVETNHLSLWQPWTWDINALATKALQKIGAWLEERLSVAKTPSCTPDAKYVVLRVNERLKACVEERGDKVTLKIANDRGFGVLAYAPPGVTVTPDTKPGTIWGEIDVLVMRLFGRDAVYIPPAATASAELDLSLAPYTALVYSKPADVGWAAELAVLGFGAVLAAMGISEAEAALSLSGPSAERLASARFTEVLLAMKSVAECAVKSYVAGTPDVSDFKEVLKITESCLRAAASLSVTGWLKVALTIVSLVVDVGSIIQLVPRSLLLLWSRLTSTAYGEVVASDSMDDDFNDNLLETKRWSIATPPPGFSGTVRETNNRLEISVGPGSGGTGIVSNCVLRGDFDVQADFNLLGTPVVNLYGARLHGPELGVGADGGVGIERGRTAHYRTISLSGAPFTATSDTVGALRLVRTGARVSGYFRRSGNWVLVGAGPASDAPTRIELDLGTFLAEGRGTTAAFDDFKVNSGRIFCSASASRPPASPSPAVTTLGATAAPPTAAPADVPTPTQVPIVVRSPSPTAVPTYTISGRVTAVATRAGIGGVPVCAVAPSFAADYAGGGGTLPPLPATPLSSNAGCSVLSDKLAVTAPSGEYVLRVPPGTYRVAFTPARDSGYLSQLWKFAELLSQSSTLVVSGDVAGIDAALESSFTVTGSVTSAVSGAALQGANVLAYIFAGGSYSFLDVATTDAGGRYVLFVRAGSYHIRFNPPARSTYASQYWKGASTESTATELVVGSNLVQINAGLTSR